MPHRQHWLASVEPEHFRGVCAFRGDGATNTHFRPESSLEDTQRDNERKTLLLNATNSSLEVGDPDAWSEGSGTPLDGVDCFG